MNDELRKRIEKTKIFLTRLWCLQNEDRPGFLIGDVGGAMIGGTPVRSALFSTGGNTTVRQRLQNPETYLKAQLEEIEGQLKFKGDLVPALCPSLGVIGIPSAFGCEIVWWEREFPAVKKIIGENPKQVYNLPTPSITDGVLGEILEYTELFIGKTKGAYPIRLTDVQGPLDSAALIFGHSNFLAAMHTHPDEVHWLLNCVTDLTIEFSKAQRDLVWSEGAEFVPSMFQPWMPDGMGISVSNDECVMISSEMHDDFCVPYLNKISQAFGGIYIHSCGDWTHQFESLEKVNNLRGLEFGASEAMFEKVFERFNGKVMLACRVGLHSERKFNGMLDYVTQIRNAARTNKGLFIHVDITNGIVDDTWPVTEVEKIYEELD